MQSSNISCFEPGLLIWGETELAFRTAAQLAGKHSVTLVGSSAAVAHGDVSDLQVIIANRLVRLEGTTGSFTAIIESDKESNRYTFGNIIVFPNAGLNVKSTFKDLFEDNKPGSVLIAVEDVNPADFKQILLGALEAMARGFQIIIAADEVQVAYPEGEVLYQEARDAGVLFFKDVEIEIKDNGVASTILVDIKDKRNNWTSSLEIGSLISFNGEKNNDDYSQLLKTLGIKYPINQESHPFETNVNGIFVVDPGYFELLTEQEIVDYLDIRVSKDNASGKSRYYIDSDLCALCLTCYRVCPHNAVVPEPISGNMYGMAMHISAEACQNCGMCYAECPAYAVKDTVGEPSLKQVTVLACENSSGPLLKNSRVSYHLYPCSGNISIIDILRAMGDRGGRVVILACRDGKCQHDYGPGRLAARVKKINKLLGYLRPGSRVDMITISAQDRWNDIWIKAGDGDDSRGS
ncbi:MAG: 4Fe-4S binding protein [Chitinophagales bacterium]